ncbi:MAG: ComEC/Rec2 family competence protein [Treponema sp.]|jgi:competence protein ComEC|nr:ComEC/Rec2 family competence protein [Treponema sp.]
MPLNIKTSPVLCAACGAALSYYGLFPLYRSAAISIDALLVLAFIPASLLSLSWVLVSAALELPQPLIKDLKPQAIQQLRLMPTRLAAFAAGLAFGIGIGSNAVQSISFGLPEDTIQAISGTVLDDPRITSSGRAMTKISLKMVTGKNNVKAGTRGEITVFFPPENSERLKEFGRGTEVFAEGELREGSNNFGGGHAFFAKTLHITKAAPPIERFRTGLRMDIEYRFTQSPFGDPAWGGLALALLVGIRDNLESSFASVYRDAGCAHILALSGMHLAILIGLISFLLKRPLGLRPAAIIGVVMILAYCYIVGPMPSLNRAALMYFLGVVAILGMLKRDALLLLCMAFLVQLAFAPATGFSLSFIFSYLALAGILIIGSFINTIFKGKIPAFLLMSISASLGAFISTAVISTWAFDILRPAGIASTLLVAPLTTVFMVGSIAWLLLNVAAPALSPLLSHPLALLYWLMERIAFVTAKLPGIIMKPAPVLAMSLFVTALIWWFAYRRRSAADRLEPFA